MQNQRSVDFQYPRAFRQCIGLGSNGAVTGIEIFIEGRQGDSAGSLIILNSSNVVPRGFKAAFRIF